MTPEQAFLQATEIAIVNDYYFYTGLFLGLILTGAIKVVLGFIGDRMQYPRRIKFSSTNGNTPDEYLYRWRGRYYTADQYHFLRSKRNTS